MECSLPRAAAGLALLGLSSCGWLWGDGVPEAPPRGAAIAQQDAGAASTIRVPLTIDLAELQAQIQQQVPTTLLQETGKPLEKGVLMDLTVQRRGDVLVQGRENGQIRLVVPLHIHAEGYHSLQVRNKKRDESTKTAKVDADLKLFVDLDLDISPEWKMLSEATVHYAWDSRPALKLGRLSLDLTDAIDEKLEEKLPAIARKIEKRLAERDRLPVRIAGLWEKLATPRPLPKPEGAWLLIEPSTLFVSAPRVSGAAVRIEAGMIGTVRTQLGAPPERPPLPLPPRSEPPAGDGEGLRLGVDAVLPWESLSEQASDALAGKSWPLTLSGTETGTLTVTGLELYPSGDQIAVGVSYDAQSPVWSSAGVLWLTGTPALDVEGQRISVDDFDYTVETQDMAGASANSEAVRERIKEHVRDNLDFPFGEAVREQIGLANEQLRSVDLPRGGTLSAQLDAAELTGVYLTDAALAARVELRGSAKIRLPPPKPPEDAP